MAILAAELGVTTPAGNVRLADKLPKLDQLFCSAAEQQACGRAQSDPAKCIAHGLLLCAAWHCAGTYIKTQGAATLLLAGTPSGCCPPSGMCSDGLQAAQQAGVSVGLLLLPAC